MGDEQRSEMVKESPDSEDEVIRKRAVINGL